MMENTGEGSGGKSTLGNGAEEPCLCNPAPHAAILRNYHRWSLRMEAVTISPKFQVVIPKKIRDALKLSVGQKIQMVAYDNRIEMIPLRKISDMKGFLKGIDTAVEREPDRI